MALSGSSLRKVEMKPSRTSLIAWLAYLMGGFNASAGTSMGRFRSEVKDINNDEEVALRLISIISEDAQRELKEENKRLKAEIYDLRNKT